MSVAFVLSCSLLQVAQPQLQTHLTRRATKPFEGHLAMELWLWEGQGGSPWTRWLSTCVFFAGPVTMAHYKVEQDDWLIAYLKYLLFVFNFFFWVSEFCIHIPFPSAE